MRRARAIGQGGAASRVRMSPTIGARVHVHHPSSLLFNFFSGRFMVRNMVDAGALNDLKAASAFELYALPK